MSDLNTQVQRGQELFNQGNYQEAYDIFVEVSAEIDATDKTNLAAVYANMGASLMNLGRANEALESYDSALEADPSNVSAQHNRALALRNLGKLDEAAAGFRKVIESKPDFLPALRGLVNVLMRQNQNEQAEEWSQKAYEIAPEDIGVVSDRATVLLQLHRGHDALQLIEPFATGDKCNDHARQVYAFASVEAAEEDEAKGNKESALSLYNRAIEIEPIPSRIFNRALLLLRMEKYEDALTGFQQVVEKDPENHNAQAAIGALYLQLDRFKESVPHLRKCISAGKMSDTDLCEARYNLGYALYKSGDIPAAVETLEALVEEYPEHANAVNALRAARNVLSKGDRPSNNEQVEDVTNQATGSGSAASTESSTGGIKPAPSSDAPANPQQQSKSESIATCGESAQVRPVSQAKSVQSSSVNATTSVKTPSAKPQASSIDRPRMSVHKRGADGVTVLDSSWVPTDEDGVDGVLHSLERLQTKPFPDDVDSRMREAYLSMDDFESVFKMKKTAFYALPKWKRIALRKQNNLF